MANMFEPTHFLCDPVFEVKFQPMPKTWKMNPGVKHTWLSLLRTGKYIQLRGIPRGLHPFERCALGVLYDVTPAAQFMLSEQDGARIARMNDNGRSFAEIADWIEVNL